jgi:hypothetical protein
MRPDIDVRVLEDKKKPSAPRIEGQRASFFWGGDCKSPGLIGYDIF